MSIHERLQLQGRSVAVLIVIAFCAVVLLFLRNVFMPVGRRRTKAGKASRLPPGPSGVPVFGNLLELARHRDGREIEWASLRPSTRSRG